MRAFFRRFGEHVDEVVPLALGVAMATWFCLLGYLFFTFAQGYLSGNLGAPPYTVLIVTNCAVFLFWAGCALVCLVRAFLGGRKE